MLRWLVPSPSPIFVGREPELSRLDDALRRVPVATVCGMGGIGKSALAYAAAARWPHGVVYRKAGGEPFAALLDDVRRQLAGEPPPALGGDDERLADVAARLDEGAWLWLLDDLHALPAPGREALVRTLAAGLRRGRLLATSRERLPPRPGDPDRLELQLDGLDEPAARALWGSLDELYGPAAGFDTALARSRGSPFQLRRAHAGGLDDEDPLQGALRGLSADERRLAGALALASRRLPTAILQALLPTPRARAALRRLVTLLIGDVDGAGTCGMHDLYREAVLGELDAPLRRELHAELARLLADASIDLVVRVREVTRHLCATEEWEQAGAFLATHAGELVRQGETAEVLRGIDAIPAERRSVAARLTRARCLGHLNDVRSAHDELVRLRDAGAEPVQEVRLAFAEIALARGDVAGAAEALAAILAAPAALPPAMRLHALALHSMALANAGRGDEGRAALRAAEARADDPTVAAHLALYRARLLFLEERDAEADEPLARARTLLPGTTLPYDASLLVPMTFASILARLGRFDEVDDLLRPLEAARAGRLDPSSQLYLERMRAGILWERGERLEALRILRGVVAAYERAGSEIGALLVAPWVGRILLVLGRRDEGLRLLDATAQRGEALGAGVVHGTVERSRRHDPLAQLRGEPAADPPAGKRGAVVRARALRALRAAAAGDTGQARALLDADPAAAEGPGYGLDRALAHLTRATLARLAGRSADAAAAVGSAQRAAAEDGADAGLVAALQEAIGQVRVVTGASTWVAADAPADPSRYDVILDGRSHELHLKRRVISFKSRPVLRRLLYTLASRPGEVFSKETLTERVWSVAYNPLQHDNSLWVNVRRLRIELEKTGLEIEVDEAGYRLKVPPRFLYLDPSG